MRRHRNNDGEDPEGLFKWVSRDHFGSREAGEEAAREATPEEWLCLFYQAIGILIEQSSGPVRLTSQDATDIAGMPPGHRSRVGANMTPAATNYGLVPVGTVKARGRHQHHLTIWGFEDDPGVEVEFPGSD